MDIGKVIKSASQGALRVATSEGSSSSSPKSTSTLPSTVPFFVYGTLRSGFKNRDRCVGGTEAYSAPATLHFDDSAPSSALYHFDDTNFPGLFEVAEDPSAMPADSEAHFFDSIRKELPAAQAPLRAKAIAGELIWFSDSRYEKATAAMDELEGYDARSDPTAGATGPVPAGLDWSANMYVRRLRTVSCARRFLPGHKPSGESPALDEASSTSSRAGDASTGSADAAVHFKAHVYFCRLRPGLDLRATPVPPSAGAETGTPATVDWAQFQARLPTDRESDEAGADGSGIEPGAASGGGS